MSARLIIAGGGTGGHLYPGLAVAEALRVIDPQAEVLFVGTLHGIESRIVPQQGLALATIEIEGVKNRGIGALLKACYQVPKSIVQSMSILRKFKPTAVLGVGGYASGPMVFAAWMMGIPTAIQEQNAAPGITNQTLGKVVKVVFTSLPGTRGFKADKIREIGNPIRASIVRNNPSEKHERIFTILVFGGSQGSRAINRAMAKAAPLLSDLKDRLFIIHQTGRDTAIDVAGAYATAGLHVEVQPYYDNMPAQYARAQLAVCRAGATSLAELAVANLPAILLPFPFASDNHQEKNADVIVGAGGAIKLLDADASGERMAGLIRSIVNDPAKAAVMARAMGTLARPNAAEQLVAALLAVSETPHV